MARTFRQPGFQPSVLDRLVDREPGNRYEAPRTPPISELREAVRRDLAALLNSRRTPESPPASARELTRSVYNYGLPDLSAARVRSEEDRLKLAHVIETAILCFEPRLLRPIVTIRPENNAAHELRFQIEALLRVEPAPVRVFFDTTLELSSGRYQVGSDGHAR